MATRNEMRAASRKNARKKCSFADALAAMCGHGHPEKPKTNSMANILKGSVVSAQSSGKAHYWVSTTDSTTTAGGSGGGSNGNIWIPDTTTSGTTRGYEYSYGYGTDYPAISAPLIPSVAPEPYDETEWVQTHVDLVTKRTIQMYKLPKGTDRVPIAEAPLPKPLPEPVTRYQKMGAIGVSA